MNQRWTQDMAVALRDQVLAGMLPEKMEHLYGVKWQTLYKVMSKYNVYPHRQRSIGVVTLKKLHAEWVDGKHIKDLAARLNISSIALRSRWRRAGLRTSMTGPVRFPKRRLNWNIGLTIWTMRSKGKSTQEICAAIGRPYDALKSPKYIRHHLLRWCYDTHTKVPSFKLGTTTVVWLPPPTRPPTGNR